jgi:hypothetical protein
MKYLISLFFICLFLLASLINTCPDSEGLTSGIDINSLDSAVSNGNGEDDDQPIEADNDDSDFDGGYDN